MRRAVDARLGASVLWMLALALGACGAVPGAGPIAFEGELSGVNERREFPFEARAGQLATIRVQCPGPIRVMLRSPSGAEQGEPGGFLPDVPIQESGTWRVRLEESQMGEAWQGRFRLTIELRPGPAKP
jgi:hypothetical protein